jgi:signal transduction histidine kinase
MSTAPRTVEDLLRENEDLRRRLEEAEDKLRAIRPDEVEGFGVARADLERRVGERTAELKAAQQKVLQVERLAAIGQLAAGLAHESGNALQRSQACLSVLVLKLADRPEELKLLARLQRAQDDLHSLHEEVREYAAPMHLEQRTCELAGLWREAWEDLAAQQAGRQVELREDAGGLPWQCLADPFRLRQVFRNLLENALAAGSDRVEIHCSVADLGGREAVRVAVRDNGPGFAPGERAKLFEPFYTTKVHGTGLGLAICKRIVEAHGGRIEAGTGPGAEIVITLPGRPS